MYPKFYGLIDDTLCIYPEFNYILKQDFRNKKIGYKDIAGMDN